LYLNNLISGLEREKHMPYYIVTIKAKIEANSKKEAKIDTLIELEKFVNEPKQKLPSYINIEAKEY
jgi:hypothetical protein